MSFNPDPSKQAEEVIFSRKTKTVNHSHLILNSITVTYITFQKHLGVILDIRLIFDDHWNSILIKINKTMRLLRKLQSFTKTGIDDQI